MRDLTRNLETENTPIWVLPNAWRLGRIRNTKFGMNGSTEKLFDAVMSFWLLNVTIDFEILGEDQQGGWNNPLPIRLGLSRLVTSEATRKQSL